MKLDTNQEYVHEGKSVYLTGRMAVKKQQNNNQRRRSIQHADQVLVEVETRDDSELSNKRWVAFDDLYEVTTDEQ